MKKNRLLQLMFLGTGSDVGKSIIAAGFCRILYRMGFKVAPFKAQNMALNSSVTMQGGEMGRAQVMQAYAAGILPDTDMNPVLLKPSGDAISQVIVQGKVYTNTSAQGYYGIKEEIFPKVLESYNRLRSSYDALILEGAGSTTEMNLKENDIVNIEMAKAVNAPVVIVSDIERGGVFASLIGTMKLLTRREKRLVMGFIINKFRGEKSLFNAGRRFIERKTKRTVFGIVPFLHGLHLPEEDSVALQYGKKGKVKEDSTVNIVVIHLPHISNYTDFDPFEIEDDVSIWYTRDPEEIMRSSAVLIPGTKNSIEDLLWMKERGFEEKLKKHAAQGKSVVGICGGYQMLGNCIEDPYNIESKQKKIEGLGLLNIETTLCREKRLTLVKGICRIPSITRYAQNQVMTEGYEIHMGETIRHRDVQPAFTIFEKSSLKQMHCDGALSKKGNVWGTYLHGLFENDRFRALFLKSLGRETETHVRYREYLEAQYDSLANLLEENVEVQAILNTACKFNSINPLKLFNTQIR